MFAAETVSAGTIGPNAAVLACYSRKKVCLQRRPFPPPLHDADAREEPSWAALLGDGGPWGGMTAGVAWWCNLYRGRTGGEHGRRDDRDAASSLDMPTGHCV